MKLVTYEVESKSRVGIISQDGEWIYPTESFGMEYKTMLEAIIHISESELQLLQYESKKEPYSVRGAARLEEVRIQAPILYPDQDVICLGINYMEHAQESARYQNEVFGGERPYAVYFSKRVNQAVSPGEAIPSYEGMVDSLDYEAELAFIIGKDAKCVKPEEAKQYVFGYTILNDVSARNVQTRHKQWYFGKSMDGFAPMGPCILTADSIAYPPHLQVQSYVNGELRQDGNTKDLIFDLDHIVSELSQGMTLKAGTIISTGTPAGAGMGFEPPRFLKPGDQVTCVVEEIGEICNSVT